MLSEADFWRGRQAQLQQRLQSGKGPSQRVGLSSLMLAHMQGSQDGRSNTVRGTFCRVWPSEASLVRRKEQ